MARGYKKMQAVELYDQGVKDVEAIAARLHTSASYVANTLASAGRTVGYHDLYTSTQIDRTRYARAFDGVLRFKDMEAARGSVAKLDELYKTFQGERDRRGMFHAEFLALTGIHRAHGCGKHEEAEVFAAWLRDRISTGEEIAPRPTFLDLWEQENSTMDLYPEALAA